jgi:SAM-dependent methyltransferase
VAFTEIWRILRPGGRLGVIWNARDRSVAWIDRLWTIMDGVEKRAPWRDHDLAGAAPLAYRPGFGPLLEASFHHHQTLDRDGIVERFASVSHVAVLAEGERRKVLDEVRRVIDTDPETTGKSELDLRYRTEVYWCEKIPSTGRAGRRTETVG